MLGSFRVFCVGFCVGKALSLRNFAVVIVLM